MTSGVWPAAQPGVSGFLQAFCAPRKVATKPFILPALTSALAEAAACGPPALTSCGLWYGFTHSLVLGSVAHTVGTPFCIGMPSAPGYVPKYESKERFSCMMITMCWILLATGGPGASGAL